MPEIKRGEIYQVDLDPVRGSELRNTRPAVIVSSDAINNKAATVIVCPITDTFGKESPIHVLLSAGEGGLRKQSVAHCGQIRSIDKERLLKKLGVLDSFRMAKISKGLKDALAINL